MATFHLKVLTVDKQCCFDGEVDRIVVRTSQGDVGILPNHVPYVAALGVGGLTIIRNGERRVAAVSGGFVDVSRQNRRSCWRVPASGPTKSTWPVPVRLQTARKRFCRKRPATVKWISHRAS